MYTFCTPYIRYQELLKYEEQNKGNINTEKLTKELNELHDNKLKLIKHETLVGKIVSIQFTTLATGIIIEGLKRKLWLKGKLSSKFKIGVPVEVEYELISYKSRNQAWLSSIMIKNESKKDQ